MTRALKEPYADAPWDRDRRRTRALTRDEHRLREALAAHEGRRFDLDTAQVLRERTEDLLETVASIAADDDFWRRLEDAATEALSPAQIERLRALDGSALAVLLEVSGYTTPPPPPVDDLVDDTLADLAIALEQPDAPGIRGARVRAAQRSLITFTMRVRRQVTELSPSPLEPSLLRASARRLGRAARWLLPKVAAVSAGALVESAAPGSGLGLVVGAAAKKVAEDGVELAATLVAARLPDGADTDPEPAHDALHGQPIDPVLVNSGALLDQLHGLRFAAERAGGYAPPDAAEIELARRAARQLGRLEDVLADAGQLDHDARLGIGVIASVLDFYLRPVPETRPDLDGALHAADWLAHRYYGSSSA